MMERSLTDDILHFARASREAQLQFVTHLCNTNSYTYNIEGTDRVAEMITAQIEKLFVQHEVDEQSEVGSHHILRSRKAGDSQSPGSIYLVGHMDTVFPAEHSFQECRLEGDWLRGPGTGDMKGGLAIIVFALRALDQLGLLGQLNLTLILGGDEEIGSETSHSLYERESRIARACLGAECAGPRGEVVTSRNGKAGARLECFGKDRHIASVERRKSSAILEMAHKIVALEALNEIHQGTSVNVGRIEGGLGPATVPATVSCLLDLRWSHEEDCEVLLRDVRRVVQETKHAECRCELVLLNRRPAMPASNKTQKMFLLLRQTAERLGIRLEAEHRRGTSDANFFGARGVPTIDGFGPICLGDHTPEERILISSLSERTALLALFLAHLAEADV
jgi:glutamate carboxypeptidase